MIKSLGAVTVGASPTRATVNESDPTLRLGAKRVRFQVAPSNAGIVYVGIRSDMDIAGSGFGTGVVAVLAKPVSATTGPFDAYEAICDDIPNGLNAADFYIHGTNAGDAVLVTLIAN